MMLKKPKKIPTTSGVYVFSRGAKPLYIGKALNLKNRVSQYFQSASRLPPKIQKMLGEVTALKFIETGSEIEALIKEAELIKKHRPKYNALMRDDKNYFFVGITKEEFPRIFVTHQPHPQGAGSRGQGAGRRRSDDKSLLPIRYSLSPRYIGPFTSGGALHTTLKLLRRVFPYCTCKGTHKRPCLNSQIGRCPGYCCMQNQNAKIPGLAEAKPRAGKNQNDNSKFENFAGKYRKNVKSIIAVLTGEKTRLIAELKKQLNKAAKNERYEEAAKLRDQIFGLEDVFRHRGLVRHQISKEEKSQSWSETEGKLRKILKSSKMITRIEGYDIANIAGKEATGSMAVFANGRPDKSQYRKFRIKTVRDISDVDMIKEVLARRLKHTEWPYPELMVIDGGRGQLNAALKALREFRIHNLEFRIPAVAALAKREEILFLPGRKAVALKGQPPDMLHLFQRIRDESHRFARAYHHKLRGKMFLQK